MARSIKPIPFSDGFKRFWSFCLKQFGSELMGGKQAAMRAWRNHNLEGRTDEAIEKMRIMVEVKYRPGGMKFVPHVSSWINSGFYDNEMEDPQGKLQRILREQARRQELKDARKKAEFDEIIRQRKDSFDWSLQFSDDTLDRMYQKIVVLWKLPKGVPGGVRENHMKLSLVYQFYEKGGGM